MIIDNSGSNYNAEIWEQETCNNIITVANDTIPEEFI